MMYRTGRLLGKEEELMKTNIVRKVILPMTAVNQTRVQINLMKRNLRPGKEVMPQTSKGQRSEEI